MRPVLALVLVLLVAGCGDDGSTRPDHTFQGDGYSFSYPGDWEERESDAEPGSADVVIAPEPGVTGISVGVFDSPQAVTAENIDGLMGELRTGAETFLAQNVEGSKLDGEVEQVTIAGLPGVAFEGTTTAGQGIRTREAWIFDGTTFYAINCSSATGNEDSVDAACDQVLETFAVDG
jgi:hypothetical protein